MENAHVHFPESPETGLSVRSFQIEERINGLFCVRLRAVTSLESLDLAAVVGHRAELTLAWNRARRWRGLCTAAEFVRVSETAEGLATYEIVIRPTLWKLTQRRGNRLFQHRTIPDMVGAILDEWKIPHEWQIARATYAALELRTQYDETDFAFVSRLLEEAGISHWLLDEGEEDATLVLGDAPESNDERASPPLPFFDEGGLAQASRGDFLTAVRLREESRPGRVTLRDYDFTHPRKALFARAETDRSEELAHEQYRYLPGAASSEGADGRSLIATPVADDLGTARFRDETLARDAKLQIEALHAERRLVTYRASLVDLGPGVVFRILNHPRLDLSVDTKLLATSLLLEGEVSKPEDWIFTGTAVTTDRPYRPGRNTPKPRIYGIQTAVVVGPDPSWSGVQRLPNAAGELSNTPLSSAETTASFVDNDIYVDEHGRVRVQFPWDRVGEFGRGSSIWMRVSQGWAGAGYGLFTVPRVGHEVLVAYLDGDPDSPLIVGRVHNAAEPVPFPLPENKTVSTWRTASSPGGGGFNELRFDDAAGREHVYLQAQKDMDHLVKNDSKEAVGHDRTLYVQRDEVIAVGHDRQKVVQHNETEVTGLNRSQTVGLNRVSTVGVEDSTLVGARWSVTVARGLAGRLTREFGRMVDGPLSSVLQNAASSVLGIIPNTPLGGVLGSAAQSALADLGTGVRDNLRNLLSVLGGFQTDPGPAPTNIEVVDRRISLSTGEASIVLDGPNITIRAEGNIALHALKSVTVMAEEEIAIGGREKVAIVSATDDVIIQAKETSHLNPYEATRTPPAAARLDADFPMPHEERTCELCRGPMIQRGDGEWVCLKALQPGGDEDGGAS